MQDPNELKTLKQKFRKIIYVDIDSTICNCPDDHISDADYKEYITPDYNGCKPYLDRIKKINKLYDDGNYILYWTARGTMTGVDWTDLTSKQLNEWGCKYHRLIVKKPYYDLFIDDKNINSEAYFNE